MKRYRRRAVTSTRKSKSKGGFHPLVAFLLIASFGILFAGCGKVQGPTADELIDDATFTATDAEMLSDVDGTIATGSGEVVAEAGSGSSIARIDIGSVPTGSGAAVDAELIKRYDSIRTPSESTAGNVYRVTNEFLNVRSAPNSSAGSVGRVNQGDRLTLLEFVNASWAKVKLMTGAEGYVSTRYIARMTTDVQLAQEQKMTDGTYFVNFAFVNIRSQADSKSDKLGEIPGQTIFKPVSVQGDWAKVSYNNVNGYVSMQFLAPFKPPVIVRQESFTLPILRFNITESGSIASLVANANALRSAGANFTTLRAFQTLLLTQEARDVRLQPKSVVIAVSGVTPGNVRQLSDALYGANIPATFFIQSKNIGISGISQKVIATLQANGFDLESEGHTGDDLRGLTNAQVDLELRQSRELLEQLMNQSVIAIAYPDGGVNDRISQAARNAGYLFGVGAVPEGTFGRDQFLRLPAYLITSSMTPEDVTRLVK